MFERHNLKHHLTIASRVTTLGHFNNPTSLCMQPHTNRILVSDYAAHRLQMLSDQGEPLYMIGGGQSSRVDGQLSNPYGLCCLPDGSIVVADRNNHRIQIFDIGGRFTLKFGREGDQDDQLKSPYDICQLAQYLSPSSSASSLLVVADFGNTRLSVWSCDGHQHVTNVLVNGQPRGICVDLNGYVNACFHSSVVQVYDPRKNYQLLQTLGDQAGSGPGQFTYPTGMCVDDTNVLMIVDKDNHRIQFFN